MVDGVDLDLSLMEVQQIPAMPFSCYIISNQVCFCLLPGTFLQTAVICELDPACEKERNMLESKEWMMVGVLESQNSPSMIPCLEVPS